MRAKNRKPERMILLFKCGYCGKEFETLSERCNCEMECGKKKEEETRRKEQEKLTKAKRSRNEDITKAFECIAKQIDAYHSDYNERCDIERQPRYDLFSDYAKLMNKYFWMI